MELSTVIMTFHATSCLEKKGDNVRSLFFGTVFHKLLPTSVHHILVLYSILYATNIVGYAFQKFGDIFLRNNAVITEEELQCLGISKIRG